MKLFASYPIRFATTDSVALDSKDHGTDVKHTSRDAASEERSPLNVSKYPRVTPERYARLSALSSRTFTTDEERRQLVDEIIRIDHAGEYGAVRIYEG